MARKARDKRPTRCPKCGGGIVWLQEIETCYLEIWRGCQNWVTRCDYREPML